MFYNIKFLVDVSMTGADSEPNCLLILFIYIRMREIWLRNCDFRNLYNEFSIPILEAETWLTLVE